MGLNNDENIHIVIVGGVAGGVVQPRDSVV